MTAHAWTRLTSPLLFVGLAAAGCTNDARPVDPGPVDPSGANTVVSVCGNGVREGTEVCDGEDLGTERCLSQGYAEGVLDCLADCSDYAVRSCVVADFTEAKTGLGLALTDDAYDGSVASMHCVPFEVASPVGAYAAVGQIDVTLAIDHPWAGDLVVKLVNPSGQVETLLHRPGQANAVDDGSGDGGSMADLVATHPITLTTGESGDGSAEQMGLGLSAAQAVCRDNGKCKLFAAPGPGPSELAPGPIAGTWQVCVADAASFSTGTVQSIGLRIGAAAGLGPHIASSDTKEAIPDGAFDGTLGSMSCRAFDLGDRAGTAFEDVRFELALEHTSVGDLVIAAVVDGVPYGLMSRPGALESASGVAAAPGATANVSGVVKFQLAGSVLSAERLGEGRGSDEAACGYDETAPCVFAVDPGSIGWASPRALLGKPLPSSITICVGDARTGDAGSFSGGSVVIDAGAELAAAVDPG